MSFNYLPPNQFRGTSRRSRSHRIDPVVPPSTSTSSTPPPTLSNEGDEDVHNRLESLRMKNVEEGSRNGYARSTAHFIIWLDKNKPEIINDSIRQQGQPLTWSYVRSLLKNPVVSLPPIHFDRLSHLHFLEWVTGLKKIDGGELGFSSLNGHKSSLKNLFRDYKVPVPLEFDSELSVFYAAIRREKAKAAASGSESTKVGKDPLRFGLYQALTQLLLKQSDKKFQFAQTFLVLSWNLMCRSKNTVNICDSHIAWAEDALTIMFAHQKNDQNGMRKDPRHIYANPFMPHICPILSLALFLAVTPLSRDSHKLFAGEKQYDRYRKIMKAFYDLDDVRDVIINFGICPLDLGTHSSRKGACTYCTSGSVSGPGSVPVHIRAGWALPGVQDTYYKYVFSA